MPALQSLAEVLLVQLAVRAPTPTDDDSSSSAAAATTSCTPNSTLPQCETPVRDNTGVAIGVGVGIPVLVALCVIFFLHLRNKRNIRREDEIQKSLDLENDDDFAALPHHQQQNGQFHDNNNNNNNNTANNAYSLQSLASKPSDLTLLDTSNNGNKRNSPFADSIKTPHATTFESAPNPFSTPDSFYKIPQLDSSQRSLNNYDPFDQSAYPPSGEIYNVSRYSSPGLPSTGFTRPSSPLAPVSSNSSNENSNNPYSNPYSNPYGNSSSSTVSSKHALIAQPSIQSLVAAAGSAAIAQQRVPPPPRGQSSQLGENTASPYLPSATAPFAAVTATASTPSLPQSEEDVSFTNSGGPNRDSNFERELKQEIREIETGMTPPHHQYSSSSDEDGSSSRHNNSHSNSVSTPTTSISAATEDTLKHDSFNFGVEQREAATGKTGGRTGQDFDRVKSVYKEYFPTGMASPEFTGEDSRKETATGGFDFGDIPEHPLDSGSRDHYNTQYAETPGEAAGMPQHPDAQHEYSSGNVQYQFPEQQYEEHQPYTQQQQYEQQYEQPYGNYAQDEQQQQQPPQPGYKSAARGLPAIDTLSYGGSTGPYQEMHDLPMPHASPSDARALTSPTSLTSPSQASFRTARSASAASSRAPATHVAGLELASLPVPHNLSDTASSIDYAPIRKNYASGTASPADELRSRSPALTASASSSSLRAGAASPIIAVYNPVHNALQHGGGDNGEATGGGTGSGRLGVLPSPHQLRQSIALMTSLDFRPPDKYNNEERSLNMMSLAEREQRAREGSASLTVHAGRVRPPSALVPDDKTQLEKLRPTMEMR